MKKPVRTPLTDLQMADARRLQDLYKWRVKQSRDAGGPVLTQTEIGERCDWKSPQSTVSQYMTGKVALNLEAVLKLGAALDVDPARISPSLVLGAKLSSLSEQRAEDDRPVMIPLLSAKAAAGLGLENPHVETKIMWPFKKSWLDRHNLDASKLVVINADGDSMQPTIADQDEILVDLSQKEPVSGCIYVLNSPLDGVTVKRLVKSTLGSWIIRSDSPDKHRYPDLYFSNDDSAERYVIGKVAWRGGSPV